MPLPKIVAPTYELELPSTGQEIKYRPFLVKEEKVLVIALESEDTKQITNAIKSVIKNCILTRGIKVETLPTFDIEYLFLNIRGKSVGETVEVNPAALSSLAFWVTAIVGDGLIRFKLSDIMLIEI